MFRMKGNFLELVELQYTMKGKTIFVLKILDGGDLQQFNFLLLYARYWFIALGSMYVIPTNSGPEYKIANVTTTVAAGNMIHKN